MEFMKSSKGGRPLKLSPSQVEELLAARRRGATIRQLTTLFDVDGLNMSLSRSTVWSYLNKHKAQLQAGLGGNDSNAMNTSTPEIFKKSTCFVGGEDEDNLHDKYSFVKKFAAV